MRIKPIKTEQHYFEALERLEEIFDPKENTPNVDEADILYLLIDNFENEHTQLNRLIQLKPLEFVWRKWI